MQQCLFLHTQKSEQALHLLGLITTKVDCDSSSLAEAKRLKCPKREESAPSSAYLQVCCDDGVIVHQHIRVSSEQR